MSKIRLDQLLVQQHLVESREQAQRLIRAGHVRIKEQIVSKPGYLFPEDSQIQLKEIERYVSRGGLKLEAAIQHFQLKLDGVIGLDIGSSTGGFTDCILQHGARAVYAVDCGTHQLHDRIRNNERVIVMEQTNARYLTSEQISQQIDFCSIDTSFISLTKILPPLKAILKPGGIIVSLIKPQFEAGKKQVGKGGVVRDPVIHKEVIESVRRFGTDTLGFTWNGYCPSPIKGPAGNIEFLAYWTT